MRRFYLLLCALCLLGSSCGLANRGAPTTVAPASTLPGASSGSASSSPSATAVQSPGTATSLPDSLYFPLLTDGEGAVSPETWVETTLAGMSLEAKIGQMLIVGIDGNVFTPQICAQIQQLKPGGITLSNANLSDPDALRLLSDGLQECARAAGLPGLLITLAHEGEYVDRFQSGTTLFPAALALGATGDPGSAYQAALASGQELAYSGVNLILGPVADVLTNYDNEVISQRTYGESASQVSWFVSQAVQGYRQAGLIPVLKHFPGHGGVAGDSHREMPIDYTSLDAIRQVYLPPFRAGVQAGAPVVMLSHVSYPAIDAGAEIPATVSNNVVRLLREEMGFTGVILSDAMRMRAVTRVMTSAEASLQGIQAGIDLLLVTRPEDALETRDWLLDGFEQGRLTEEQIDEAVRRVLTLKAKRNLAFSPQSTDVTPDWQANQELAFQLGEQAVTLIKDDAGLVPLPKSVASVLVMGPGENWELYPALEAALSKNGFNTEFYDFPPPWEGAIKNVQLLEELSSQASKNDLVLLFTWQAHLNKLDYQDTWQVELVQRLVASGTPLIVVAIKSPTDILEFPDVSTFIAMYGTTPGQEQALIDALVGRAALQGVNPLPGLLP